jgi:hypothetical protein
MTIKNCIKFHLHWAPAIILALVLIVAAVTPAHATEIDNDGNIGKSEVIDDDLILNGEIVNMDGTVNGLLIASGQTITINGIVNGDAILLASSVIISEGASIKGNVITFAATTDVIGQIDGSLIGANSAVTFHKGSSVGRNVYFAGFSLKSEPDSVINRDLYSADYQVILNGTIGRNANVAAAAVELSGKIANNANFNVEAPTNSKKPEFFFPGMTPPGAPPPIPTGLRIYESAEIGGQMIYTSPSEQASAIGKALLSALRNLITLLILGALVLWLIPSIFQKTVDQAKNRTLPAAGYGVLTVLAGYLGSVLIAGLIVLAGLIVGAITLGGLSRTVFGVGLSSLALIMAVFTLLVSYGSKLVIAFLVGQWVVQKTAPQSKNQKAWALVTGVVIYVILRSIPIFGWLVGVIATVIGVGAMWMLYQNQKPPIPQGDIPPAASEV